MEQSTAQRRLVKSPPELWAEVSSEDALGRRLAPFGDIRITRVQPETTVAWEGERASGTVELEPAGWGTRVTLTATPAAPDAIAEAPEAIAEQPEAIAATPEPPPPPSDVPTPTAAPAPRRGFLARLLRRRPSEPAAIAPVQPPSPSPSDLRPPAPGPEPMPPDPDPAPTASEPIAEPPLGADRTVAVLTDVLDDLGAAHHRPFSRD